MLGVDAAQHPVNQQDAWKADVPRDYNLPGIGKKYSVQQTKNNKKGERGDKLTNDLEKVHES